MKIVIASDHSALELKAEVKNYIDEMGHDCTDIGTHSTESCDYPDFGYRAAVAVAGGEYERGILICGTGIGISLAANKVKGIRCAVCSDTATARLTREHNDANMISIGARIVGGELAKDIISTFLTTEFSAGERHIKRLSKITAIENGEKL